ncbi:amidohydrolase [Flavimobilis soli]|uniref:Amidohydrolase n=1 Tax=Flavimobilis soli TaxID=442709 RepID=A0A2A9ECZ7_9MICO|nr:amidohydrolase [Flavimobilis soli]
MRRYRGTVSPLDDDTTLSGATTAKAPDGPAGVLTPGGASDPIVAEILRITDQVFDELVSIRRDIHAHPELARTEIRTTALVAERLAAEGLAPRLLPGSGLVCDIPAQAPGDARRRVALRADLDALPVQEATDLPYSSTVPGVSHACGHDVHTAVVLGAGIVLARLARQGLLEVPVRLVFQPAEEVQPGGALDLIAQGAVDGVERIYAVHCEPKLDTGVVGTRIGPITSASDEVTLTFTSRGGHTSRPHLTGDLVYAMGQVISQVPAILGRRLDPRSGVNLTWGAVNAGRAHNAIPTIGTLRGTLRCLDVRAWELAAQVLHDAVEQVVSAFGVGVEIEHNRGVPPVENDADGTTALEEAARAAVGPRSVQLTEQSLGGEDFAWYLTKVPGALARLGTRLPGGRTYDIHQADFRVDEEALRVGVRLLATVASRTGR